jgi:GNAT superfamily N-acetyltransferase
MAIRVDEVQTLEDADAKRILAGVSGLDPADVGPRRYQPLYLTLRDETGALIGGLIAATLWTWLSIDVLWVDPSLRGRGHGRTLLRAAENAALARGCTQAQLATFDWQARHFYERNGYTVWGELTGFPAGHSHFQMRRHLAPAS